MKALKLALITAPYVLLLGLAFVGVGLMWCAYLAAKLLLWSRK